MPKKGKNIYQRKDGRWEGRYAKGRIDGKTKYGYVFGRTYEDVEGKLDEISVQASSATATATDTFSCLSLEWLLVKSPQIKPSSVAKYTNMLNLYLIPIFGHRQISNISRSDIVLFSTQLLISGGTKSDGLAPKTVNSVISLMKNILEYAEREKGLSVADTKDLAVKQPQKPMRVLSRTEQKKLSIYLSGHLTPCHLGILLCLYTGLRIGEICALKWEDIDIDEQCLTIHQTMQRVQINGKAGKKTGILIQAPKSDCSIRKIPIPNEMFQLLLSAKKQSDAFLLTGMVHSFVEPRSMENHFKAAARECGIHDVHFHTLRHTFATRCVELGFDIKSLSEILGHASVNITLNRYVHPSMELKQKNMNMLSELLTTK